MSYALRYYDEYYSRRNHHWRLELLEDGYTGSSEQINLGPDRVRFTREAQGDSINKAIKGSECTVQILATSTLQYYPLFDITPMKYLINVYKDTVLYWQGYVSGETYQEPYAPGNFYVTLRAYDGITFLKNIKYLDSSGNKYTGKASLLAMLARVLNNLTPVLPFVSMVDLYESSMDKDYDDEPLNQVYVDQVRLYAMLPDCTCADVLSIIIQPFGQLRQHFGKWQLMPVRSLSSAIYGKRTWDLATLTQTSASQNVDLSVSFTNTETDDSTKLCLIPDPILEIIPPLKNLTITTNNGMQDNAYKSNDVLKLQWADPYKVILQQEDYISLKGVVYDEDWELDDVEIRASFSLPIVAEDKKLTVGFTVRYTPLINLTEHQHFYYRFYIKTATGIYYQLKSDGSWLESGGPPAFTKLSLIYDADTLRTQEIEVSIEADSIPYTGTFIMEVGPGHWIYHFTAEDIWSYTVYLKDFVLSIDGYDGVLDELYEYEPLGMEEEEVELMIGDATNGMEHQNDIIFSTAYFTLANGNATKAWRKMPSVPALSLRQWLTQNYESIRGKKSILTLNGEFSGYIPWVGVVKDEIDLAKVYLPNAINDENTGDDSISAELVMIDNYNLLPGPGGLLLENGLNILLEDDSGYIMLEENGVEVEDPNSHFEKAFDTDSIIVSSATYDDVVYYAKAGNSKIFYIDSDTEQELVNTYSSGVKQIYGNSGTNPGLAILTDDNRVFTYCKSEGLLEILTDPNTRLGDNSVIRVWMVDGGRVCYIDSLWNFYWNYLNVNHNEGTIAYGSYSSVQSPVAKEVTAGKAVVWLSGQNIFYCYYSSLMLMSRLTNPVALNNVIGVGPLYLKQGGSIVSQVMVQTLNTWKLSNATTGAEINLGTTNRGWGFASCKFSLDIPDIGTRDYLMLAWTDKYDLMHSSYDASAVFMYDIAAGSWRILNKIWYTADHADADANNIGVDIVCTTDDCFKINRKSIWKLNKTNVINEIVV